MEKTMDKIVALAKARGFVYPGSEIYGGLANTWDYGNLGVELKNNVKRAWWQKFIQESPYNVGVDCAILMNPQTWVASGHIGGFSDPLMDCKECHERFRADKIIEDTEFSKLVEEVLPDELKPSVNALLAVKMKSGEKDKGSRIPQIDSFIEVKLNEATIFPVVDEEQENYEKLDKLFLDIVR